MKKGRLSITYLHDIKEVPFIFLMIQFYLRTIDRQTSRIHAWAYNTNGLQGQFCEMCVRSSYLWVAKKVCVNCCYFSKILCIFSKTVNFSKRECYSKIGYSSNIAYYSKIVFFCKLFLRNWLFSRHRLFLRNRHF